MKKQGLLPLVFKNPADYDRVQSTDHVDLIGVETLAEGSEIKMVLNHKDGSKEDVPLVHTFNSGQIVWCTSPLPFSVRG